MQESAQLAVVEPGDYSFVLRAPFLSYIPMSILLDSVPFRGCQHDRIDAVLQRNSMLPSVAQGTFELLLSAP